MRNPKFKALLDKMLEIHEKKNSDYSSEGNPYSNFEFAGTFAGVEKYRVYLTLLGVKVARLHELLGKGKTAKNESIDDTLLDFATYAAIMASDLMVELVKPELFNNHTKLSKLCDYCDNILMYHIDFKDTCYHVCHMHAETDPYKLGIGAGGIILAKIHD